jgi:hypothetical protein
MRIETRSGWSDWAKSGKMKYLALTASQTQRKAIRIESDRIGSTRSGCGMFGVLDHWSGFA